jgi:hypothetical protein
VVSNASCARIDANVVAYQLSILVAYIYTIWLIPLILAYELDSLQIVTTIFLTAIFMADMAIDYHTLRMDKLPRDQTFKLAEVTIQDWQRLYRNSWQPLLDIISIFPFDLLPVNDAMYFMLLRFIRVRRLAGIMMTSPIYKSVKKGLEEALGIGQAFSGIFSLTFLLCAYLHIQACIISIMGRISGVNNPTYYAQQEGASKLEIYTWSLFQAVGNTFPLTYR